MLKLALINSRLEIPHTNYVVQCDTVLNNNTIANMYVCMYVRTYVHTYIHTHIHTHTHTHTHTHIYIYISGYDIIIYIICNTYIHTHTYIYIYQDMIPFYKNNKKLITC